jgi:peptidoglycan/LPS O-acetylase OafA/YrhL
MLADTFEYETAFRRLLEARRELSISFEGQLVVSGRRPAGFDYLRISLAMGVIVWHSFTVPYGMAWATEAIRNPLVTVTVSFILPAFFVLSGFLVSTSLERAPSLFTFLGLRVIRIVPALGVEIILSALLLGPLLTTLPLRDYFTDRQFAAYFLNIAGSMHYSLPGLFKDNPFPDTVNAQLWTVPWELRCYIAITLLAALGFVRRGRPLVIATSAAMVTLIVYLAVSRHSGIGKHNDVYVPGAALVLSFLWGVTAYRYRDAIPYRAALFWIALGSYIALMFAPYGSILATIPIAYLTLFIGLWNGHRTVLVKTGDYSYGVYIYGFAIQQALFASGAWARHWWVILPLTTVLVGCFAAFSWFLVEKPSLEARRFLPELDRCFHSVLSRLRSLAPSRA